MKSFFFLFFVVVLLESVVSDDPKDKVKQAHRECQDNPDTHLDEALVRKALKGEEVDKSHVGAHAFCMTVKLGLQHEDGTVNKEHVREALSHVITDETKLNESVTRCTVAKANKEETAEFLYGCVSKEFLPEHGHGHSHHDHAHHH